MTLVGPTRENLVLDPLAVLHLDNRLYMSPYSRPKDTTLTSLAKYRVDQTGQAILLMLQSLSMLKRKFSTNNQCTLLWDISPGHFKKFKGFHIAPVRLFR